MNSPAFLSQSIRSLFKQRCFHASLLVVLLASAPAALAYPLVYNLSGVTFDDGAVATGSFVFDPQAYRYGSINPFVRFDIVTTDGAIGLLGTRYNSEAGFSAHFIGRTGGGFDFAGPEGVAAGTFFLESLASSPGEYPLSGSEFWVDNGDLRGLRGITSGSLIVTALPGPGLQQQIPASEYAALRDLYRNTDGSHWANQTGWNDPAALIWYGVDVFPEPEVDAAGQVLRVGHVFWIGLSDNNLVGSIPETLSQLANLHVLLLEGNQLSGPIPESLGNMTDLQSLYLGGNQLSGTIPESLGNLANLSGLSLYSNQLAGAIPESLVNLAHLGYIVLTGNCFNISPGSQARSVIDEWYAAGKNVQYQPQNLACQPATRGDLNYDGCVDRADLSTIMTQIRNRSQDLTYDLNGDGKVDVADARFLVLHFTNSNGSPCLP
jgi:hypothetical protein